MAKDDADKCSKAFRQSAAFRRASFHPSEEIWTIFADAEGFVDVVDYFNALVSSLNIDQNIHGIEFYEVLKSKLTSWKCQSLWDLLNTRIKCAEYKHDNKRVGKNIKCMVIGAGPIGLRTAIELLMLGCQTVVVERRSEFSRNNVLHLWPFLLTDFRGLGAKKFYGKFGAGCIDHINIKTLQTTLLKVALVLGVEIYPGVEFKEFVEPTDDHGWRARLEPAISEMILQDFNVIIGADGKKNVLPGFTQVELRGSLAIGITCNFINNNTPEETSCKEISGISYQFKPMFFEELKAKHGVELENIVYYKDETHYFVMTARKTSLLNQGVILRDYGDPAMLVKSSNINKNKLLDYTCKAVKYATTLQKLQFKKLANGEPDIALFDFTSLKKAENASRIIERKKHKLLLSLVGDSLIEPFWPTGSGCGRGVLSALDAAWMVKQFALSFPPLALIRERENVFKLLSASTNDSLQKNYNLYTIDPKTRYSALDTKKIVNLDSLRCLYDTDDVESADLTINSPSLPRLSARKRTAVERRRSNSSGVASRPSGRSVSGKTKRKLERQESKQAKTEEHKISIGDKTKFFEEHNRKMDLDNQAVPKVARTAPLSSSDFSGLEGIDEDEDDDDVMMEEEPAVKKKHTPPKQQSSKEIDTTRHKPVKRQSSRESIKRQSSKEFPKITKQGKLLKRQSSKDGSENPSTLKEDGSASKKKVFQAKGGGLKSKAMKNEPRLSEKSDSSSTKQKVMPSSDKKSATVKKKTRKHVKQEEDEVFFGEEKHREKGDPVDAKTFFSKWMGSLLPKLQRGSNVERPLETCAQASVVSVMALTLLLDCNKAPRRTKTESKLQELLANMQKDGRSPSSFERREGAEELSSIRVGCVKASMAKWQMLAEKEEQKSSYYDFVRKTNSETATESDTTTDGILLTTHGDSDFTPKDVIDVEEQLLAEEEEERKRSGLAKVIVFVVNKFLLLLLFIAMLAGLIVIAVHFILVS